MNQRPAMSLAVVGADFPNRDGSNRRFELRLCRPGEEVSLQPEPRNPVDPNAVAVLSCRGVQIGYLTAERCVFIRKMMREGFEIRAVFERACQFGAWIRVAFHGELPVVALAEPVNARSEPAQDFWPDEVWPDE